MSESTETPQPPVEQGAQTPPDVIGEQVKRQRKRKPRQDSPPTVYQSVMAVHETKEEGDELEPVSRLIEEAPAFFQRPSWLAAGAFSALEEHGITELTRKQGEAVIKAWLGAETNSEPEGED